MGDCELGMIFIWVVHEKLDTYVCACGHELGMSYNGSWWLVDKRCGFGMRRNILLMVGNSELVLIQCLRNEDWLWILVWYFMCNVCGNSWLLYMLVSVSA